MRALGIADRSSSGANLDDAVALGDNIRKCGISEKDILKLTELVSALRPNLLLPNESHALISLIEFAKDGINQQELLQIQSVIDTLHDFNGATVNISNPKTTTADKNSYIRYRVSDILYESFVPFKGRQLFFSPRVFVGLPGSGIEEKDFFLIGLAKSLNLSICSGEVHSKMQVDYLRNMSITPINIPAGHIFEVRADGEGDIKKILKTLAETHRIKSVGGGTAKRIAAVDEAKSSLGFVVAKNVATLADPGKKTPESYNTGIVLITDEVKPETYSELAGGSFEITSGFPRVSILYTSPFKDSSMRPISIPLNYTDRLLGGGPGLSINELTIILTCLFTNFDVKTILVNNGRLNAGRILWGLQLAEQLLRKAVSKDKRNAVVALITFLKAVGDLLSVKCAEITGSALVTGDRLTFANAVKHKVKLAAFTHGSSPRVLLWRYPIDISAYRQLISNVSRDRQLKEFLNRITLNPKKASKGGANIESKNIKKIIESIINLFDSYSRNNANYLFKKFDDKDIRVIRHVFPLNTFLDDVDEGKVESKPDIEIYDEKGNYVDNPNIRVLPTQIFRLVSDVVDDINMKIDDETIRERIRLFFEYNGYYRGEPIVEIVEDILVVGAEVPNIDDISEDAIRYIENEIIPQPTESKEMDETPPTTPSRTESPPSTPLTVTADDASMLPFSEERYAMPTPDFTGGDSSSRQNQTRRRRQQKKKLRTRKVSRLGGLEATFEIVPYQP